MTKLTLTFTVGSLGALLLGLTQGCGTNESASKPGLLGDAGAGGAGGGDAGGIGSSRTPIGRSCLKDNDCGGGGLICLTSDSKAIPGGGPPNGMCVADCSADPKICKTFDATSICVSFSASATALPADYCMQSCLTGPPATGEEKCHNRADVGCDDLGSSVSGLGFCRPACRDDSDCGARKCNLGTGLCSDARDIVGTLPIGSPCDPSLTLDPCTGFCVALTSNDAGTGPGVCAGLCPRGSIGCGTDPKSADPPAAACIFVYSQSSGRGDLGQCGKLCDCNDECKAYRETCRPFTAAERQAYGRKGYCGTDTDRTTGKPVESIPCANQAEAGAVSPDAGNGTPDAGADAKDAATPGADAGDAH